MASFPAHFHTSTKVWCFLFLFVQAIFTPPFFEAESAEIRKNPHQQDDYSLSMAMKNDKFSFAPNENIDVDVILRNNLNQATQVEVDRYAPFGLFEIELYFFSEKVAPTSLVKARNSDPWCNMRSYRKVTLNSGQDTKASIRQLNRYFDMTLEGRYSIVTKWPQGRDKEKDETISINSDTTIITIDNGLTVVPWEYQKQVEKTEHGVVIRLAINRERYDEYGQVFLQMATKNISAGNISTPTDTGNVFDGYELTLKNPGSNLDFRKPKKKAVAGSAEPTLYGQKLLSEKSKTSKPLVTVKPGETVAETVVVLNRIFDMSEDGIYGLIVSRKFVDADGKEQTITSDPLPIRIGTALTQDEIDQRVKEREERDKADKAK